MSLPQMFVISPEELTERDQQSKEHFRRLGLKASFFNGLYGPDTGLESHYDDPAKPYSRLPARRISLMLNHWFLWQHIALSGLPAGIIFEDDVVVPTDFTEKFHDGLSKTPSDWDVIYLGITYPERLEDCRIRCEKLNDLVWRHHGMNAFDGTVDGCWAYMLSLQAAKRLASMRFVMNEPVDRWLTFNALEGMNVYIWHPSFVKHP